MGPHEPYWRTNTSFSPPPSRWDFRFETERLPDGSNDVVQLHGSSTSSSRNWVRGDHRSNHQYSTSDGAGAYFSSPSDISPAPQWIPPAVQGFNVDDYDPAARRDSVSGPYYTPTMEGTSAIVDSGGSTSSRSDGSECEPMAKLHLFTHRNVSSRRSFMSKPIHPLSFPTQTPTREASDAAVTGYSENEAATPQRDVHRWSSASSSIDYTDVSEQFDAEISGRSYASEGFKCGLCERFLSQRSPWSSRRIVRSGDMPIAGVLSCCHVFHAECLDQITPKTRKNDPPCPLCVKSEEDNSPEQRAFSRLKSGFPRLRPFCEDGPSKPWGCAQAGDCVEGALHAPPQNAMLLLNRNRIKKNLSLKGNSSKDYPGKLRKNGSCSSQLLTGRPIDQAAVGCSKAAAPGSCVKR
ncbi:uncharacterized protein LOC131145171 [Malania oleifera]|uniref:uncharacterized protein LOC131145171 n=1 Tax=Malania oleifera TaxID=397392 RepID=UPI0025AE1B93|nr:uncharacterized protein LOC131145171 [Malania oleifera]XP_057950274.1 uncharacterized protein LOC131145171 [Malania oleifera]XP_057950276.1 uncharacterized protein LOC131145171 [Malania oleifera]XP_057950277.1 uncharacterized protein LOC131145171 [Malania oleifera]XP_057950278.1 uncharacterized protein LOC131145171 [Malania oleifera]XP_057950279.1 uncharacterized protein LOC131145171 [Malania oleifera]